MRGKTLLLGVLVAALLVFGCTQQQEKSPKEQLKELLEKSQKQPEMKLEYDYSISLGGAEGTAAGAVNGEMEMVNGGDKKKTRVMMDIMGMRSATTAYEIGGKTVVCMESSMAADISCQVFEEGEASAMGMFPAQGAELEKIFDRLEEEDVELLGEKTVRGRQCREFKVRLDSETMKGLYEEQGTAAQQPIGDFSAEVVECLDKEYGFAAEMKTSLYTQSGLAGEGARAIDYDFRLKAFSREVSGGETEPPVAFAFPLFGGLTCAKNSVEVRFTPLKGIERAEVSVEINGEEYSQSATGLGFGEEERVSLQTNELGSSNDARVCIGGECHETSCYASVLGG